MKLNLFKTQEKIWIEGYFTIYPLKDWKIDRKHPIASNKNTISYQGLNALSRQLDWLKNTKTNSAGFFDPELWMWTDNTPATKWDAKTSGTCLSLLTPTQWPYPETTRSYANVSNIHTLESIFHIISPYKVIPSWRI